MKICTVPSQRQQSTRITMTRRIGQAVDQLDNERRVRILGVIDRLRELGVSENVSLPQVRWQLRYWYFSKADVVKLVVVGDQSSGKSSLLEGLTGISFPVASDLCTRFATQIVLRRAPADAAGVKIRIIPGPSAQADKAAKARLLGFERELSASEFDNEKFLAIFDEVRSELKECSSFCLQCGVGGGNHGYTRPKIRKAGRTREKILR
jgi:hypothetical protein